VKENSIEETKKQLELILKVRKEQKEIIECAGGSCINCNPDIKALTNSIDILSDYKRVLKENEELKADNYELNNRISDLLDNIPVQEVKDKIEELKQEKKKYGNCLIEMYEDELVNRDIKILQELLEGRK
jgi:hypothetical protein